jgi:hypothetical protein
MAYITVHHAPEPEPPPGATSGWLSFALGLLVISTALAGGLAYYLVESDDEAPRRGQRSPPVALRELPADFQANSAPADIPPMSLPNSPLARGVELIQSEKWQEAAELYEKYLQHQPNVGQAWHFLGLARLKLGELERASIAWRNAARFPGLRPIALYNLACTYALKNDVPQALDYLEQALRVGFDQFDLVDTDTDLDALRSDPRFAEAVGRAKALTPPETGLPPDRTAARPVPPTPGTMIPHRPTKDGQADAKDHDAEVKVIHPGNVGGRPSSGSRPPTGDQMPKPGDPDRPIPVRAPGVPIVEPPAKPPDGQG